MTGLSTNLPLVIYWIVILGNLLGATFIVYHLIRFGLDYKTRIVTFAFLIGSFLLLALNFYLFSKINWDEIIDLKNYLRIL